MAFVIGWCVILIVLSVNLLHVDCLPSKNHFEKIVDGREVEPHSLPYQAALIVKGSIVCGGTIIGQRHILTAAHCCVNVKGNYTGLQYVEVGIHKIGEGESYNNRKIYDIGKVVIHKYYNIDGNYGSDIAMVFLTENIKFNKSFAYPINIAQDDAITYNRKIATVSGWGSENGLENTDSPKGLKSGQFTVIPNEECGGFLKFSQICLEGVLKNTTSACFGDSGGPVVFNNTLIGVVSYVTFPFCTAGKYNVHTRVSSYFAWINQLKLGKSFDVKLVHTIYD